MKTLACALALAAIVLSMAGVVSAVELKTGDVVLVPKDKPIEGDVTAAANQVSIRSGVKGDVLAAGKSVEVSGPVKDSVMLAGRDVVLANSSGNDAFMAGAMVAVAAPVADNAYLAGRRVDLTKDGSVGVDLLVGGEEVGISGKVGRDLRVGADYVTISGEVGRNVYADVENLRLTKNALIKGDLYYDSPRKAIIDEGAKVLGKIHHRLPSKEKIRLAIFSSVAWRIGLFISALIFGAVALAVFPNRSQKAADTIKGSFWSSAGIGLILLIVIPITCVIAMISVVGIPLALAVLAIYFILIYASRIFAALALGQWILGRGRETKPKPIGSMILGLLVFEIALPLIALVPALGGLVSGVAGFFILITGLGGLLVSWYRDRRTQAEGAISG